MTARTADDQRKLVVGNDIQANTAGESYPERFNGNDIHGCTGDLIGLNIGMTNVHAYGIVQCRKKWIEILENLKAERKGNHVRNSSKG